MSYKYQNGGTPDHVNSDDSNSSSLDDHGLNQDPKKPIPVDTVAVKDRIKNMEDAKTLVKVNPGTSDSDKRADSKTLEWMNKTENAAKDTLSMARNKKIPAKP